MKKIYFYIRFTLWWWGYYEAYKVGITENIINRGDTYITSEPERGKFTDVWEVNIDDKITKDEIDELLIDWLKDINFSGSGGKEFYKSSQEDLIKNINNFFRFIRL